MAFTDTASEEQPFPGENEHVADPLTNGTSCSAKGNPNTGYGWL